MPEVIQIRPKGIYINIEFSLDELELLKKGLDNSQINLNMKNDEEVKISDFMANKLYPLVAKVVNDIKGGA